MIAHILVVVWYAAVWAFIVSHQLVIYHFACAAVDRLPAPRPSDSVYYKAFFWVAQYAAANYKRGNLGAQGRLGGGTISGQGSTGAAAKVTGNTETDSRP